MTVLINNASSSTGSDLLAGDLNDIRLEMDTAAEQREKERDHE